MSNEYYLEPSYDSSQSFYKKARVVQNGDKLSLISYSTTVCEISLSSKTCNILGFYSNTTTRHIRDFLYQNGFEIGSQKFLWEHYTKEGQEEVAEKQAAREARELARAEKKKIAEERHEAYMERKAKAYELKMAKLEKRKEKLRKSITLELGDRFSKEEIEALVLSEIS